MVTSLGLILIGGLFLNYIFSKMKLPGLLGMLILGVLIGPNMFNLIDEKLMYVSAELRKLALIVILLRAGLGISKEKLNEVGFTAIKMSFIPGVLEGFTISYLAMKFFDFTFIQGSILGFIIAAVSPAVVVPLMLEFSNNKIGTKKNIPTLILAGASIDDVVAITIFSTFLGLYSGSNINIGIKLLSIPLSILLGIGMGVIVGFLMIKIFNKYHIRDTKKVLIILSFAIFLTSIEQFLKNKIEIAALLGVMTIGFIILEQKEVLAKRLANKFNKIWIFAEILLFVLVGAQVDVSVALEAGKLGIVIILLGLISRSIGVIISIFNTNLNQKEKLFCIVSYWPKATVQAAIGAIPLSFGVESGDLILALAVLSIVITAPIGAILIKYMGYNYLQKEV